MPTKYSIFAYELATIIGRVNGRLATQCRSRQSLTEFPANREFYRESRDFGRLAVSATKRRDIGTFEAIPTPTNRELYLKNRVSLEA
jgi:hypothetical protein